MKRYTVWILPAICVLVVLRIGKPLLIPLVLAVFIGYLIRILTDGLAKIFARILPGSSAVEAPPGSPLHVRLLYGARQSLAFFTALVLIVGALYFMSRLIMSNITEVAAAAPAYQYNLEQMSRRLFAMIPWHEPLTISKMVADIDIGSMSRVALREVTGYFSKVTLVAIYLLFIFLEQRSFKDKLRELVPDPDRLEEVRDVIREIDKDVRKYLKIKFIASFITALVSYAVFISVGLNFASFWAFLIFLLNFIPTIGSIVATALPSLLALVQFESLAPFLVVLIGVTSVQMLIGNIIEPRIQGENLNLSPLIILISLALWNMIWGIAGMFLCVPMTAIALIVLSRFEATKVIAIVLSKDGKINKEESAVGQDSIARITQIMKIKKD